MVLCTCRPLNSTRPSHEPGFYAVLPSGVPVRGVLPEEAGGGGAQGPAVTDSLQVSECRRLQDARW
jgi:hypothetical protein